MAGKDGERSASSATQFTATTPHASSKVKGDKPLPRSPMPTKTTPGSRGGPKNAAGPAAGHAGKGTTASGPGRAGAAGGGETPEQRVARLRAAHLAAKNAKVSRFDQILAASRPFFDSAHRITVTALVGLTAVATVMTAYTAYDMMRYNTKRKVDFDAVRENLPPDSFEAARLAYMRGDATEEQRELYERARDLANATSEGMKMPKILSAPTPIRTTTTTTESEAAATTAGAAENENKSSKWWGLFSKASASKEEGKEAAAAVAEPQPQMSLEEKRALLETTLAAYRKEKENQKNGGPLDRVGAEAATQSKESDQPKKKGWLW